MATINLIKKKKVNLERELCLCSSLCLVYGHRCPRLEGNVVDKGQAEIVVDINHLLA